MTDGDEDSRDLIRSAALEQFARHGFKGATVRGIAEAAGVSAGLVQHHFPSKRSLQQACDEHVLHVLRGAIGRGTRPDEPLRAALISEVHGSLATVTPYLAQSLVSGTASAQGWFDEISELYRKLLTGDALGAPLPAGADVDAIVVVHTAMQLGLAILAAQVFRRLDADQRDVGAATRIAAARLHLMTRATVGPEAEARIRAGLDEWAAPPARPPSRTPTEQE